MQTRNGGTKNLTQFPPRSECRVQRERYKRQRKIKLQHKENYSDEGEPRTCGSLRGVKGFQKENVSELFGKTIKRKQNEEMQGLVK